MYPRLSSLPGASGDTDVYVFCAPRSWRKNIRTLFYALCRGRNYSEDGNIRAAQRVGAEIAETLMICDINAIVNELRAIKSAISALELSVTVPPQRCCPPGNGEPGLPPPAPEPPPPDTPPSGDLPLAQVYCRAARALARNLRAILRDLAALALFNALTPAELQRALTRLGLDQTTVKFISITAGLLSFIYRVLSELLDNLPDPVLRTLHDALIAASDAIDEELFTCCFVPMAGPDVIAGCSKQKIDELELNVLMSAFVKLLIWPEKISHFITGKARNADGELVDINWHETGISHAPCCQGDPVWTVVTSGASAPACPGLVHTEWRANAASFVDLWADVSKDGTYGAYGFRVERALNAQSVTITLIAANRPARAQAYAPHGLGEVPLPAGQPVTIQAPQGHTLTSVYVKLLDEYYFAPCPQRFELIFSAEYG